MLGNGNSILFMLNNQSLELGCHIAGTVQCSVGQESGFEEGTHGGRVESDSAVLSFI